MNARSFCGKMDRKINLKARSLKELELLFKKRKEPSYRAGQLFVWIWKKGIEDISLYTNFSKRLREYLKANFYVGKLSLRACFNSEDGSVKYVFERENGERIESVFIPCKERRTVCVSTQVGCPLGCSFCATGKMGIKDNLSGWEIADQVLQIARYQNVRVSNVVFMGMGEPFLNWENVKRAIFILNSNFGMNIGSRKMTISTAGIIPGIYSLADFSPGVRLAVSLNSAIQEKREKIMPVAKKYSLSELKRAIEFYYEKKHRMVTLEYVLINSFNTAKEDFLALKKFSKNIKVKINLIPLNPVKDVPFLAPSKNEIARFYKWCLSLPCSVNIRESRGRDVRGACGQLAIV